MSNPYLWRVKVNIHHLSHHCMCVFEIRGQGLRRQLRLGKKQVWAFSPCFENACCEAVTHFCFTDNQRGQGQRGVGMQTVWGWEIFGRNMGRNIGPWSDARNSAYLEVGWVYILRGDHVSNNSATYTTPKIRHIFFKPSGGGEHLVWWMLGVANALFYKWCGGYCNLLHVWCDECHILYRVWWMYGVVKDCVVNITKLYPAWNELSQRKVWYVQRN